MKRLFTIFTALLISANIFAQSPQKMSYQSVLRNSSEQLLVNQSVGIKISILQGSTSGTSVYSETHSTTTNANGLISLEIGTGSTTDDFSAIDWSNGTYFIKTETDPAGGTNYTINGVSQILSVPYALHAKTAETFTGNITTSTTGDTLYFGNQYLIVPGVSEANMAKFSYYTSLPSAGVYVIDNAGNNNLLFAANFIKYAYYNGKHFNLNASALTLTEYDDSGNITNTYPVPNRVVNPYKFIALPDDRFAAVENTNDSIWFFDNSGNIIIAKQLLNRNASSLQSLSMFLKDNQNLVVSENGNDQVINYNLTDYSDSILISFTNVSWISGGTYYNNNYYICSLAYGIFTLYKCNGTDKVAVATWASTLYGGNIEEMFEYKGILYASTYNKNIISINPETGVITDLTGNMPSKALGFSRFR